jgi:hypothetical protein
MWTANIEAVGAVLFFACCVAVVNGFGLSQSGQRQSSSSAEIVTSRRNFFIQTASSSVATTGVAVLFPQKGGAFEVGGNIVFGDESSIMSQKEHGTTSQPVQSDLLYGVSNKLADKICSYTRHFAVSEEEASCCVSCDSIFHFFRERFHRTSVRFDSIRFDSTDNAVMFVPPADIRARQHKTRRRRQPMLERVVTNAFLILLLSLLTVGRLASGLLDHRTSQHAADTTRRKDLGIICCRSDIF